MGVEATKGCFENIEFARIHFVPYGRRVSVLVFQQAVVEGFHVGGRNALVHGPGNRVTNVIRRDARAKSPRRANGAVQLSSVDHAPRCCG